MNEIWQAAPELGNGGWLRSCEVSNFGRVRTIDYYRPPRGRPFAPGLVLVRFDIDGYRRVELTALNKKRYGTKVARLVATAFVSNANPDVLIEIDHLDNNRQNDFWRNLEWVDPVEQQRRRADRQRAAGLLSSQFCGVSWNKRDRRWCAQIVVKKKRIHLGNYSDEYTAALVYNQFVVEHDLDHRLNKGF